MASRLASTLRDVSALTLALALVGLSMFVGSPASAAELKPRKEEWWFIAWDIQNQVWHQTRGRGITVGLVDSGVQGDLPELRDVVLPGFDARHGKHADARRYDFDSHGGHGTGMAGLIAGQGGPSGMVGIAPDVKILPIIDDGFPSTMAASIVYAADHGAQVINVSQGAPYPGGCPGAVQAAVLHAVNKGAVVVASMGNEGNTTNGFEAPASCAGVLGVGAVANNKLAWTDTQRHGYVSVAAPGVHVGLLTKHGGFANHFSGTSQASALASGAVALVRSKFPRLTPRRVVQRMINTTVDAGPSGHDNMTGSGVIVPIRALTQHVAADAPNPTFARLDQWREENPELATMWDSPTPTPTASSTPSETPTTAHATGVATGVVAIVAALAVLGVVAAIVIGVVVILRRNTARRVAPQPSYRGQPMPYPPPPGFQYPPPGPPPSPGRRGQEPPRPPAGR